MITRIPTKETSYSTLPVITALLQALWEVGRGQESRESRLAPNEKVYLKTGIERHIQVKYENGTRHHF